MFLGACDQTRQNRLYRYPQLETQKPRYEEGKSLDSLSGSNVSAGIWVVGSGTPPLYWRPFMFFGPLGACDQTRQNRLNRYPQLVTQKPRYETGKSLEFKVAMVLQAYGLLGAEHHRCIGVRSCFTVLVTKHARIALIATLSLRHKNQGRRQEKAWSFFQVAMVLQAYGLLAEKHHCCVDVRSCFWCL